MGRFSVKQTSDGRYMFNLIANNNRVISSSQTYASVANAKIGIESVRTNCAAPVEDQTVEGCEVLRHPKYEVYLDVGGKPRFRLKASNGEITAVSQAYADKSACMKGIARIGSHAPDANIFLKNSDQSAIHNGWPPKMNGPTDFGFMRAFRRRYL